MLFQVFFRDLGCFCVRLYASVTNPPSLLLNSIKTTKQTKEEHLSHEFAGSRSQSMLNERKKAEHSQRSATSRSLKFFPGQLILLWLFAIYMWPYWSVHWTLTKLNRKVLVQKDFKRVSTILKTFAATFAYQLSFSSRETRNFPVLNSGKGVKPLRYICA